VSIKDWTVFEENVEGRESFERTLNAGGLSRKTERLGHAERAPR
jgi:hypothetical protein